jgi:signal peptidase I
LRAAADPTVACDQGHTMNRLLSYWREWRTFIVFVVVLLLFRSAVADWNQIPSGSMKPNLLDGDRILVDKLAYDLRVPFTLLRIAAWSDPQRGDIVTFVSPHDERLLVKRVVGLPGDQVEMRNNRLFVNNEPARYERLGDSEAAQLALTDAQRYELLRERVSGTNHIVMLWPDREYDAPGRASFGPVTVPPKQYLMLGDNRDDSADYRVIGFVDRARVLGRTRRVAFSIDYDNYWLPRPHRFFVGIP